MASSSLPFNPVLICRPLSFPWDAHGAIATSSNQPHALLHPQSGSEAGDGSWQSSVSALLLSA